MDEDEHDLPLIGPHEGRELELMLAGRKRVAYFGEVEPREAFAPYVETGQLVRQEWPALRERYQERLDRQGINAKAPIPVVYCVAGAESEAEAIKVAMMASFEASGADLIALETQIGRLLGYPRRSIDAYIEKFVRATKGA